MKVIDSIMSVPSSNAAVERLFSLSKPVKSETRIFLKKNSLVGLFRTKAGLRVKSCHARDLKMNPELSTILRAVKSNATDAVVNQLIMQQLSSR